LPARLRPLAPFFLAFFFLFRDQEIPRGGLLRPTCKEKREREEGKEKKGRSISLSSRCPSAVPRKFRSSKFAWWELALSPPFLRQTTSRQQKLVDIPTPTNGHSDLPLSNTRTKSASGWTEGEREEGGEEKGRKGGRESMSFELASSAPEGGDYIGVDELGWDRRRALLV